MPQERMSLESLKKLDFGKIEAAFDSELTYVVKDCQDRPMDERPRKVAIVFTLAPEVDTKAGIIHGDKILVGCEIMGVVPKRRTQIYSMNPKQDGSLMFQPDDPDDASPNLFDPATGELLEKPKRHEQPNQ